MRLRVGDDAGNVTRLGDPCCSRLLASDDLTSSTSRACVDCQSWLEFLTNVPCLLSEGTRLQPNIQQPWIASENGRPLLRRSMRRSSNQSTPTMKIISLSQSISRSLPSLGSNMRCSSSWESRCCGHGRSRVPTCFIPGEHLRLTSLPRLGTCSLPPPRTSIIGSNRMNGQRPITNPPS